MDETAEDVSDFKEFQAVMGQGFDILEEAQRCRVSIIFFRATIYCHPLAIYTGVWEMGVCRMRVRRNKRSDNRARATQ